MRSEDLKEWLAAARQGEKERETATKDGGGGGERDRQTEAEGHWERVVELIQQLAAMREEVLYVIFLDLTKVHDALDRSRFLGIL